MGKLIRTCCKDNIFKAIFLVMDLLVLKLTLKVKYLQYFT